MLIDFEVENFRSFGERRVFSMLANSKIQDHKDHVVSTELLRSDLLRSAVIYGANGAGKSNLIRAIDFAARTISSLPEEGRPIGVRPFGTAEYESKSSTFQFRFLARGQIFTYGFSLTSKSIESEWLSVWDGQKDQDIFVRQDDDIQQNPHLGSLPFEEVETTIESLEALQHLGVRSNQLLLSKLFDLRQDKRGALINSIAWWFHECLVIIYPNARYVGLFEALDTDPEFLRFAEVFLETVDTGICTLNIERTPLDTEDLPQAFVKDLEDVSEIRLEGSSVTLSVNPDKPAEVIRRNIFTQHALNNENFHIPLDEESDGTRRILELLPALYHMQKGCGVFLIDELDRSLHPELSRAFLKFFLDSCPRSCRQLVVTTHELHLLDQKLLRRDEIWLAEKNATQQTELSSLSDLETRKDRKLAKNYLAGRFGGIPHIRDTQKLKDLIDCEGLKIGSDA